MQVCMHAKLLQSCLNDRISKIIYSKLNSIQEILVEVLIGLCFFFFFFVFSAIKLCYPYQPPLSMEFSRQEY